MVGHSHEEVMRIFVMQHMAVKSYDGVTSKNSNA